MSSLAKATIMAPIGATGMLVASLVPVQAMVVIGEVFKDPRPESLGSSSLTLVTLFALGGSLFLGAGMTMAAILRRSDTSPAHQCLLVASFAFGMAVVGIGYGNALAMRAFGNLAGAMHVNADRLINDAGRGRLPLLIGYACVVIGAGAVCWASLGATSDSRRPRSAAWLFGLVIAVLSSFLLSIATLRTTLSAYLLHARMANVDRIAPDILAIPVSGLIFSVFFSLVGVAGFSFSCLIWYIANASRKADVTGDARVR